MMLSGASLAQQWEFGALAGFGWYHDAAIKNPTGSAQAGFKPGFAGGVVFGDNMYQHIGGELRYMFRLGGPELQFQSTKASASGYTNIVHYDLLIHTAPIEAKVRPYVAAGAGIKIYTGPNTSNFSQPLVDFAVLLPVNQVEPLISLGGGLKYTVSKGVLLRLDFRTYMTPCPNQLFRPVFPSTIHGWVYDFLPTAGISYVF